MATFGEQMFTLFTAEAWLQRGYAVGVVSDSGKLAPLHSPGGTPVATMSEDVLAGDFVVVEHVSGQGFHAGCLGRNATAEEVARYQATMADRGEDD